MFKRLATVTGCSAVLVAGAAQAEVMDDFETGEFSTAWSQTSGAVTVFDFGGGATGGNVYAHIGAAGGESNTTVLGGTFFDGEWDNSFDLTFDVRVQETGDRAFNLQASSSFHTSVSSNNISMNLVYQGGAFELFEGGWNEVASLGQLVAGEWHRMRVEGRAWGTENAHYNIHLSDAGGTEFTRSATGLSYVHSSTITEARAHGFNFNALYGDNPGFDVDNVVATVPEPGSLALLAAGGLLLLRRRGVQA